MSRRLVFALIATLLLALPCAAAPAPERGRALDGLAWLVGGWGSEREGTWTEEWWIAPRFGMMLGVNRSGREGKRGRFEFIRITEEADGSVVYWGGPQGVAPTPFKLERLEGEAVAFTNEAHDFPQRVEYRREGGVLTATVSGTVDGKRQAESWTWQRIGER